MPTVRLPARFILWGICLFTLALGLPLTLPAPAGATDYTIGNGPTGGTNYADLSALQGDVTNLDGHKITFGP